MIVEIIIVIISIIIMNKFMMNRIEKTQEIIEKTISLIVVIISDIFLIIYYIDRFNLPTKLGINTNINTQGWLTIITTLASSTIAAIVGGLIAFGIARDQIKESNRQNNENNRIQNMPLLKYEITTKCSNKE